jgi:hypothetical protein
MIYMLPSLHYVQVLSKLGLKKELDTGSMKLCGMRLERLSSLTPLPFAVAQKASLLVQQVVAHANNQPDKKFLKEFATLKYACHLSMYYVLTISPNHFIFIFIEGVDVCLAHG